jgi:ZIP family zinc transporter
MSFLETVLLGAIAGLTIYIGLPLGRMQRVGDRTRVALAMFSVGILAFIFMDVASHGQDIVATALASFRHHHSGFLHVLGLFVLLAISFTLGTAGISVIERRLRATVTARPPIAGAEAAASISGERLASYDADLALARKRTLQTGMTIAAAIGLHNFAEGLAIGVSARSGAIGLATMLIIGFGLHNASEGFGIVGPLGGVRPSWTWLGMAGLVAGGPTFLGSVVGYQVHSNGLELAFYGLAGGAILYVVGEIWTGMRRYGHRTLGLNLLAIGFLVGVATDLVVTYGGA